MSGHPLAKKARTIITTVLIVYAGTVAVNLGEFWPFSIYPMFSQGGNTWHRSLVREFAPEDSISWEPASLDALPGDPFSVRSLGVDPIDLANFVSKTITWDEARVAALRRMFFKETNPSNAIVVYRVTGELTDNADVRIEARPYVVISPAGDRVSPELMP